MTKILVLGAGKIGTAIAKILLGSTSLGAQVKICDSNPEKVRSLPLEGISYIPTGACLTDSVDLKQFDYLVNAAPIYDPGAIAKLVMQCVINGVHYLDVSEDVDCGRMIAAMTDLSTPILVAPQCGLAPGLISIAAADLISKMGGGLQDLSIDIRVGALPRSVSNSIMYLCNWSVEGLINEYMNPATIIENRIHTEIDLTDSLSAAKYDSDVILDGIQYESALTSGGGGTLLDTFSHAKNLTYRTIRYPGHFAEFRKMAEQSEGVDNPRQLLIDVFSSCYQNSPSVPVRDVVLGYLEIQGLNPNTLVEDRGSRAFRILPKNPNMHTAISASTAGSVCAILELHHFGEIRKNGYLKQEEVKLSALLETGCFSSVARFEEI